MASAPQSLPLFYNALEPLSTEAHADFNFRLLTEANFLVNQHAIPVTVDEFVMTQRWMPIVFTVGADSIPIALMGLNEGVNVYVGDDGKLLEDQVYVPAYVRRYPFMLARLRPDAEELSLCFDPSSNAIGKFDDGQPLFENGQPGELVKGILGFNEQFEQAGARTTSFMQELRDLDLLMEGEVTLQVEGNEQPFIYRGFQMIDENKLNALRGDQLRKMQKSGLLPLIYAHLFSLSMLPTVFNRQMTQGKGPAPQLPN